MFGRLKNSNRTFVTDLNIVQWKVLLIEKIIPLLCVSLDPSYNLPKLSACAVWNTSASTFATVSIINSANVSIFINTNNTVYASMGQHEHVLVWSGENGTLLYNISTGLGNIFGIFSTSNDDLYIDHGRNNRRIDRWSWNTMSNVVVVNVTSRCFSMFIDIYGTLYCSFIGEHKVNRIILNDGASIQTTIAGNGTSGSGANMLFNPIGIFLDQSYNLYVADYDNHRIQKFPIGQLNGITVAGNGTPGSDTLNHPMAVLIDGDGYLYICDSGNDRILRSGPSGIACIVGCTGLTGAAADQLDLPHSISFDRDGNLFVVDSGNARIQKFFIMEKSCSKYLLFFSSNVLFCII